jgi:Uma2 family endonuclease
MTVTEFLHWEPGDERRYELVNGEPRAMAPAAVIHAYLQNQLGRLIGNHLSERGSECVVLSNPGVVPHLLSAHNVRIPDLGVTCVPLVPGQVTLADPVLLIEILSPGNQAETWSNVWTYTSIPNVREILVLDSTRRAAEILRRRPDGAWPDQPLFVAVGALELSSIDFRVPLAVLYARTGLPAG